MFFLLFLSAHNRNKTKISISLKQPLIFVFKRWTGFLFFLTKQTMRILSVHFRHIDRTLTSIAPVHCAVCVNWKWLIPDRKERKSMLVKKDSTTGHSTSVYGWRLVCSSKEQHSFVSKESSILRKWSIETQFSHSSFEQRPVFVSEFNAVLLVWYLALPEW